MDRAVQRNGTGPKQAQVYIYKNLVCDKKEILGQYERAHCKIKGIKITGFLWWEEDTPLN